MNRHGFSLIELLTAIAVMGVLTGIAVFNFKAYSNKSAVEAQTRKMYSDIMGLRSKALYEKRDVSFRLSAAKYEFYSSTVMTGPIQSTALKSGIIWNNASVTDIDFDSQGISSVDKSICVNSTNEASVDSLIISKTMIKLGKLRKGTNCAEGNITAKQ